MSDPQPDDRLTRMMRNFMTDVREQAGVRDETDVVDRILAAASFVLAALIIAWPTTRKAPSAAALVVNLGRQIWRRRHWWLFT